MKRMAFCFVLMLESFTGCVISRDKLSATLESYTDFFIEILFVVSIREIVYNRCKIEIIVQNALN